MITDRPTFVPCDGVNACMTFTDMRMVRSMNYDEMAEYSEISQSQWASRWRHHNERIQLMRVFND